jgi:hypothetical protein
MLFCYGERVMNAIFSLATVWILIVLAAIVGWVMNVVKLIGMIGDGGITTMFVARIVGVPVGPLGAILGYF